MIGLDVGQEPVLLVDRTVGFDVGLELVLAVEAGTAGPDFELEVVGIDLTALHHMHQGRCIDSLVGHMLEAVVDRTETVDRIDQAAGCVLHAAVAVAVRIESVRHTDLAADLGLHAVAVRTVVVVVQEDDTHRSEERNRWECCFVIQMADRTMEARCQCTCCRSIVRRNASTRTDSRSYSACCGRLGSCSPYHPTRRCCVSQTAGQTADQTGYSARKSLPETRMRVRPAQSSVVHCSNRHDCRYFHRGRRMRVRPAQSSVVRCLNHHDCCYSRQETGMPVRRFQTAFLKSSAFLPLRRN